MKKVFIVVILFLFYQCIFAQNIVSKFRVNFSDKNNSPYSLTNPSAYLSAKAIARRANQNISMKLNDIPVNPWYVDSIRKKGATVLTVSKWFNCASVYTTDTNVIKNIKLLPFVLGVDTIGETILKKKVKPIDNSARPSGTQSYDDALGDVFPVMQQDVSFRPEAKSNVYNYGLAATQVQMIKTEYLHNLNFQGQGMVIAVLDAGFFKVDSISSFDTLWDNSRILGTKDFVTPGGNVFTRSTHGMMVLSIMGGNVPNTLVGTAPKASYWLLRSEDSDSEFLIEEDNWVAAAEFADSVGADVINSSLGYTTFDNPKMNHTYQDMNGDITRVTRGADIAATKGILVVNSAGNSGNNGWYYIGAPADADSILSVGAVNDSSITATFSSHGPTSDGRIKPSVCAMGQGTFISTTNGTVTSGNGTSFSSPVMAGAAACLWQANPMQTNMNVINAVIASSNYYLSPNADYGYGIPNLMIAHLMLQGLSVQNFDAENSCNIFPNPFQNEINLVFYSTDTIDYTIEMYDLRGRLVYKMYDLKRTQGMNSITINGFEKFSKGYYLLKIKSGNLIHTEKIFKSQN